MKDILTAIWSHRSEIAGWLYSGINIAQGLLPHDFWDRHPRLTAFGKLLDRVSVVSRKDSPTTFKVPMKASPPPAGIVAPAFDPPEAA